jgi:hypothetical protein
MFGLSNMVMSIGYQDIEGLERQIIKRKYKTKIHVKKNHAKEQLAVVIGDLQQVLPQNIP